MSRRLIISDVHGFYDAMVGALKDAKYNPDSDSLICLGDMINRGPKSREVIRFMRHYADKVILGNHETGLPLWLMGKIDDEAWFGMGGEETANSYSKRADGAEQLAKDAEWISTLEILHEDKDFYYVHAGLNSKRPLDAQSPEDTLWGQHKEFYKKPHRFNKTVIHGHMPVRHLYRWNNINVDEGNAIHYHNKIGIDGGSIAGGYVFVYDADNKVTYRNRVSRGLKNG